MPIDATALELHTAATGPFLYHVTSRRDIVAITRDGLRPGSEIGRVQRSGFFRTRAGHVYLLDIPSAPLLRREASYQEIDLSRTTFEGFPALHWAFEVPQPGVLLHKEDEFFFDTTTGASVAILTAARADQYARLAASFASLRQTLSVK